MNQKKKFRNICNCLLRLCQENFTPGELIDEMLPDCFLMKVLTCKVNCQINDSLVLKLSQIELSFTFDQNKQTLQYLQRLSAPARRSSPYISLLMDLK